MTMSKYRNREELNLDLRRYRLEQQIASEKLKSFGHDIKEHPPKLSLVPSPQGIKSALGYIGIARTIWKLIKKN